MLELEYLTNKKGQLKAVVVPIKLWEQLFSKDNPATQGLSDVMEAYYLNQAMDEAKATPLLNRAEALTYLDA